MGLIKNFLSNFKYYGIAPYYTDDLDFRLLSGSSFDYKTESGLIYDNSVVAACINFVYRKLGESSLEVQKYNEEEGIWEVDTKDSYLQSILYSFNRPNKFYDHTVLWYGIILSLSISGNAFLYKKRNARGELVGFDYISHTRMKPRGDYNNNDGSKLITHYEYTPPLGGPLEISADDILHLRWGVDPSNVSVGHGMFSSVYREICCDNELATSSVSLAKNKGMPGTMFSPKAGLNVKPWKPDDRKTLIKYYDSFVKSQRGKGFFAPLPVDIVSPAFSPEQMQIGSQRNDLAARIAAPYGLDVMVLGLPSENKTYSNFSEALDAAIENCFIPILTCIARQITYHMVDITRQGIYRFWWNTSEVRGLQEDINKLHERVRENFKSNMIDLWTAKIRIGEKPDAEDKGRYFYMMANTPLNNPALDTNKKDQLPSNVKKALISSNGTHS